MLVKGYLAVVGLMYIGLAIWCTASPAATSEKVGLTPQKGSGESEFMTVYGGLEFGLGIFFLLPLLRDDSTPAVLLACLFIHAALVAFRTASFFRYPDAGGFTTNLAIGEWILLLATLGLWFYRRP